MRCSSGQSQKYLPIRFEILLRKLSTILLVLRDNKNASKASLHIHPNLLTPFSNIFLGLSIILTGFSALLHAYKKLIQDYFEHWLQMTSLSVIPANLCIAYILYTIASQHFSIFSKEEEKLGISVILILLNSTVVAIVILRYMRTQIRKMKQLCRKHQCSFKCCMACLLPCVEPGED